MALKLPLYGIHTELWQPRNHETHRTIINLSFSIKAEEMGWVGVTTDRSRYWSN